MNKKFGASGPLTRSYFEKTITSLNEEDARWVLNGTQRTYIRGKIPGELVSYFPSRGVDFGFDALANRDEIIRHFTSAGLNLPATLFSVYHAAVFNTVIRDWVPGQPPILPDNWLDFLRFELWDELPELDRLIHLHRPDCD